MKLALVLPIFLAFSATCLASADSFNVMIIDSSFAPVESNGLKIGFGECHLIDEMNRDVPEKSACYDQKQWKDLASGDRMLMKGYLDYLAGRKNTEAAGYFRVHQMGSKKTVNEINRKLNLLTHGSRSALLLQKASQGTAKPLLVRNVSAQVGSHKTDGSQWKPILSKSSPYENGCKLRNWQKKDLLKFAKEGQVLPYQQKISDLLKKNSGIKMVSMSWGYKHSWIQEDNPRCNGQQVGKEYFVLRQSWQNLFNQHKDVLFITAIGNEAQNYGEKSFRNNDLWASLSQNKNLVLVGALNEKGRRAAFSNYGLEGMAWEQGEKVALNYPLPWKKQGYLTAVNGTSSSAPIFAGKVLAETVEKKVGWTKGLATMINHSLPNKWTFKDYYAACQTKDKACLNALSGIIKDQPLWAGLREKFNKIQKDWFPAKIQVRFVTDHMHAGTQRLQKSGNMIIPVVELSDDSDPYEMLLTLQHELHHIVSIEKHIGEMKNTKKLAGCVTKYQLLRLQDEKLAYQEEILFWMNAPEWFRKHLAAKKMNSRLFAKEIGFAEYYTLLNKKIVSQENFIIDRYIDLDQAPKCAAKVANIETAKAKSGNHSTH